MTTVYDSAGSPWVMVRIERQDGSEMLDICPGQDDDLTSLGVYAWALWPTAKSIHYKQTPLENPVKTIHSEREGEWQRKGKDR